MPVAQENTMIVIPPITITDAILDSSSVAEDDNDEWVISTPYVSPNKVMVSTVEPDIHENFEAQQNTTGDEPWLDDGSNWLSLGATNRWAMFDQINGTQTIDADEIDVSITPGEVINSVSVLNVSAATVQVIVTDPTDGEVYNTTKSMLSDSGISDWYAYYFTPIERITDVVFLDLPAYKDATIRVIVAETGADVAVGVLVLGSQKDIGITNHGTSTGIIDYSVKDTDSFGNFIITKRRFAKRAEYAVTIETSRAAAIQNLLASLRTTPAVWIGHEDFGSTLVYGYYREFDIILSGPNASDCDIVVEGLT